MAAYVAGHADAAALVAHSFSSGPYSGHVGGFGAIGNMFPSQWDWKGFWSSTALISIILFFLLKFSNAEFIFSIFKSFFVQKTSSINETFGVGTLIATPSSFPFREGIISAMALDAPVEVGTID